MKRFLIGFAVGFGLMYWYLQSGPRTLLRGEQWMKRSASEYRDDRTNSAARELLGDTHR
jgi:hypothetical protein